MRHYYLLKFQLIKALIAVAAVVILMLLIFPVSKISANSGGVLTQYVYKVDTVDREVLVHDTIVQFVEKPVYIEQPIYVEAAVLSSSEEEPRLLEVNSDVVGAELNSELLINKGTTLKDDNTAILIMNNKF